MILNMTIRSYLEICVEHFISPKQTPKMITQLRSDDINFQAIIPQLGSNSWPKLA